MLRLPDNICVWDNVVSQNWCDDLIRIFDGKVEEAEKHRDGTDDFEHEGIWIKNNAKRHDTSLVLGKYSSLQSFDEKLRGILCQHLNEYMDEITGIDSYGQWTTQIEELECKMQRTPPGGGFCQVHYEQGNHPHTSRRYAVWAVYLNDLPEHCGTDFLNQDLTVEPRAGRLVIWPAAYTHPHRCSTKVDRMKYIVTGWFVYHAGAGTPEVKSPE